MKVLLYCSSCDNVSTEGCDCDNPKWITINCTDKEYESVKVREEYTQKIKEIQQGR